MQCSKCKSLQIYCKQESQAEREDVPRQLQKESHRAIIAPCQHKLLDTIKSTTFLLLIRSGGCARMMDALEKLTLCAANARLTFAWMRKPTASLSSMEHRLSWSFMKGLSFLLWSLLWCKLWCVTKGYCYQRILLIIHMYYICWWKTFISFIENIMQA